MIARLECAKPAPRAELGLALVCRSSGSEHLDVLRRNVALHPRGSSAPLLISALSGTELRLAQKADKTDLQHRVGQLQDKVDALAAAVAHL